MATAAQLHPPKAHETLTIEDRGFSGCGRVVTHDIGIQAIIDGAAGCGWLITPDRAALVQQHIVSKGWQGAFRDTAYSSDPVHVDFRAFVFGGGCSPEIWIEAAKLHLNGPNREEHQRRIAVMEGLIARREAHTTRKAA